MSVRQQRRIGVWTKQQINLGQVFIIGGAWEERTATCPQGVPKE